VNFCVKIGDHGLDGGYSLLKGRDLHNCVAGNGLLMSYQCDDQIASLFFQLNEGQSTVRFRHQINTGEVSAHIGIGGEAGRSFKVAQSATTAHLRRLPFGDSTAQSALAVLAAGQARAQQQRRPSRSELVEMQR